MGMGPNNTSLLHKLGRKAAHEMTDAELFSFLTEDRETRTKKRVMARLSKSLSDAPKRKSGRPSKGVEAKHRQSPTTPTNVTLEEIGMDPDLARKLRATGKTDAEIIAAIRIGFRKGA